MTDGFWDRPTVMELGTVLSSGVLDGLERRGGFLVLCTHLFRRPAGLPIDEAADWSPLVELPKRHQAGRIKIASLARMLRYAEICTRLRWQVHQAGREVRIDLGGVAPGDLPGITFYMPAGASATLCVDGEPISAELNPPDETGRPSVSVPWDPLRYPPDLSLKARGIQT